MYYEKKNYTILGHILHCRHNILFV